MGRVAWSGVSTGSNRDGVDETALRQLLDDFGNSLEATLKANNVSPFIFPIFRPFNLVAGFTTTDIVYILSANPSGMPFYQWYDWRKRDPPLDAQQVVLSVKSQLGWREPSVFTFPLDTLNKNPAERDALLRLRAEEQFKSAVKSMVLAPIKAIAKDLIVGAVFAALFGYLFTVFPQVIPALPWVAAILLGLLVAFVLRRLVRKSQ